MKNRRNRSIAVCVAAAGMVMATSQIAVAASSRAQITGSGSGWSANAVNQWVADVTSSGLQVVYTSTGSAQGRKDFTNRTTDFAVSDIGYQGVDQLGAADSPCQNPQDKNTCRAYAYLPIVAGGTSFPYQIKVAGKLVRNLRLSGQTLAKIFTNQITNWNDPAVTADNNGRVLPSIAIIPVLHGEGSGATAQFTRYFDKQFPSIWRPFLGRTGSTEYFPRKGQAIAQNGSDGVINFVTSGAANGAIGYDEFSYALAKNFPVVKLKNEAGFFTLPTQYNVAVALTKASINQDTKSPDYLLQNLDRVYDFTDSRTYPLSSYSYMIIPTAANDSRMTTAKRQTLADYLYYSICQGQAEMGPIGYSPLPINLVQASFDQTAKLKVADSNVDLTKRSVTTCNNPTFVKGQPTRNYLAEIAPRPPACDKVGAGPCKDGGNNGTAGPAPSTSSGTPKPNSSGAAKPGTTPAPGSSAGSSPGGATSGTGGTGTTPTGTIINPDTGEVIPVGGTGGDQSGGSTEVVGTVTELAAYRSTNFTSALAPVVALEIIALLALPPMIYFLLLRRRRDAS